MASGSGGGGGGGNLPLPVKAIVNAGQVPVIKATRDELGLNYEIANRILQRVMDLVYKRAKQVVLDLAPNFEGDFTMEDIDRLHHYMYSFVGQGRSIPLDVLMGLTQPNEPGKVVMEKQIITELFGSDDPALRQSLFEGIEGVIDPGSVLVRFGEFYRGSPLHAIFLENRRRKAGEPLDSVQYHMTIGREVELDDLARGYHFSNYFYGDPRRIERTFYTNSGTVLAGEAAARDEAIRRRLISQQILAAKARASAPLTPTRKRAYAVLETLGESAAAAGLPASESAEKRARESVEASAASGGSSAASGGSEAPAKINYFDAVNFTISKPMVTDRNGVKQLIVQVFNKGSRQIVAELPIGNLIKYGGGIYIGDVLDMSSKPIRSDRGRKQTIDFEESDIPAKHRDILVSARNLSVQPVVAAAAGGGPQPVVPAGEPLVQYMARENFSKTELGDILYNIVIAVMSNQMPTSPIKINVNSGLLDLVNLLLNRSRKNITEAAPEFPRITNILERYGLYQNFEILKVVILRIINDAAKLPSEIEQFAYRFEEFTKLKDRYPHVSDDDIDSVLLNTYVTDPNIYINPPLIALIKIIANRLSKLSKSLSDHQLKNIVADIFDAVRRTPNNHPSIRLFKKEILDKTPIGLEYAARHGPFTGKQAGGARHRRSTRQRSTRRRRTRKAN